MISLIVPFASDDPRRQRIFAWVIARWKHYMPDEWEVSLGMSDPEDFSRSAARNRAVERSHGEILVITDADTFCDIETVYDAIHEVLAQRAPWVIAHTEYFSLSEPFTDDLLEQVPWTHVSRPYGYNWSMKSKSQAGVLVVPRAAFDEIGGYDERFLGWGYEDNAFATQLDRKWGQHERVDGDMLHLWHEPGLNFKQPNIKHNERLYAEIQRGG